MGQYNFSEIDAESTVAAAHALLDHYPATAQPELAPLRAEIDALLASGGPDDVIDDLFAMILSAREGAARAGTLAEPATGSVTQLSVSDGGVPKTAAESVEVDFGGVTTDRQSNRKHHGRPFQALCLWSAEIISELAADGHPIAAGSAGENITTTGIDLATLTMGSQLRIGSVLAQISSYAVPCAHQAQWFTDGDVSRLHHLNGSISRLYATVIEPGVISVGDEITVEGVGSATSAG